MRLVIALFALSAAAIAGFWAWLGAPVAMPQTPLAAGEKLYCVSYAPFRAEQTPFDLSTHVSAKDIDDDLARLARLTDCVRTYSTDFGIEQVPAIAARHGLKVIQGVWLSTNAAKSREQIETAVKLAGQFPDVIKAIVVGNEVLLRGDMTARDLAETIRAIKQRVNVPVTYADVWEFWLRHREIAAAVDFITIHILPYWEDLPIAAASAAEHVGAIRRMVANSFAGKDVLIGEVGWPSAGRMREAALPSPSNQARVMHDVLALAKREQFRVNLIEAIDQPWKRALEGTVGGHWGLFDAGSRTFKFQWGDAVSDHPLWKWQAGGGIAFALLVFGAAYAARRDREQRYREWFAVAATAAIGGALIGWTAANVPLESLGIGGWARSLALALAAFAAPPLVAAALISETPVPRFSRIIGPYAARTRDPLAIALGLILMAVSLLAILTALGLVFDPRYKDFPFAPLTAVAAPFLLHSLLIARPSGARGAAEIAAAGLLAVSAGYIVFSESISNWQSVWLCAALAAIAVILVRVRDAQG